MLSQCSSVGYELVWTASLRVVEIRQANNTRPISNRSSLVSTTYNNRGIGILTRHDRRRGGILRPSVPHRTSRGNVRTVGRRHAILHCTRVYSFNTYIVHYHYYYVCRAHGRTDGDGSVFRCREPFPAARDDRKLLFLRRARRRYNIYAASFVCVATVWRRVAYCARDRKRRPRPVLSPTYNLVRTRARHTDERTLRPRTRRHCRSRHFCERHPVDFLF